MITKAFEKNIINTWGNDGKAWLEQLPVIIESLAAKWQLSDIQPVNNLSYNYVALVMQEKTRPVVVKISCDGQLVMDEYKVLKYFDGCGAIEILAFSGQYNALLLTQAIPGETLKASYSVNEKEAIKHYAGVVNSLSKSLSSTDDYTHVSAWCSVIDTINDARVPVNHIKKAKDLRDTLLSSIPEAYLCHGDLHLENIIQHNDTWLAIDPKGVIGEMAFEAAAFDLLTEQEFENIGNVSCEIIKSRIVLLANMLNIDFYRLIAWVFLRTIISAQWFIEDNGDPSRRLALSHKIYSILEEECS